ncbi:unnamed protein product, partial [Didymodactylos carnosus]
SQNMSYEEVDRPISDTDIFTQKAAASRYAKPKNANSLPVNSDDKNAPAPTQSTEIKQKKKKVNKLAENGEHDLDQNNSEVKPRKKKRAPEIENGGDVTTTTTNGEQVTDVKPKKKAPKIPTIDENGLITKDETKPKKIKAPKVLVEDVVEATTEVTTDKGDTYDKLNREIKPKKVKKPKAPKRMDTENDGDEPPYIDPNPRSSDPLDESRALADDGPEVTDFLSEPGLTNIPTSIAIDETPPDQTSEFETNILTAYGKLVNVNFAQYVGNDKWTIEHPPKSSKQTRKIFGFKRNENDKSPTVRRKATALLTKFRTGMGVLLRDEKNLVFGEQYPYDQGFYNDEEDGVDTDNLHRYAQRLRELEDEDREINPEFLVLKDGKTMYGVHEAGAEGESIFSTRKPIYDRHSDQTPDEIKEKKKILDRLRGTFRKQKSGEQNVVSPKTDKASTSTPKVNGKNRKLDVTTEVIEDEQLE